MTSQPEARRMGSHSNETQFESESQKPMSHHFIQSKIMPALAVALLLAPLAALTAAEPSKPNIIFVLFDDLGYGQPQE